MRICVSASANSLDASVDPRFGRCPYFIIVDSETMQFEVVPNPALGAIGGAGIQAAQIIASKGAKVVITGNVGPNAFQALSAAGIKIITGAYGTVREVVEKYRRGELKETNLQLLGDILEWEWAEGVVGGEGNGSHGRCRG
jgi:predicted Fe-Mo cluster-binding NifX family protein